MSDTASRKNLPKSDLNDYYSPSDGSHEYPAKPLLLGNGIRADVMHGDLGAGPSTRTSRPTAATVSEVEQVIVTGSIIPTAEEVGPNPVLTINHDIIEKSGERTAEELIRNTTVAGPNGVPSSNNGTSPTAGASSISLRGSMPAAH